MVPWKRGVFEVHDHYCELRSGKAKLVGRALSSRDSDLHAQLTPDFGSVIFNLRMYSRRGAPVVKTLSGYRHAQHVTYHSEA